MYLNIITPCVRPYNLHKISKSINIPKDSYRWIVIFDNINPPDLSYIPNNCEYYCIKNKYSYYGNAQRNYGLSLIDDGHIYFNDDDTTVHPNLWQSISHLDNHDFISFKQQYKNHTHRLDSNKIELNSIDSHNFIVHKNLCHLVRFSINRYDADGIFAINCFNNCRNPIHLNEYLSVYNSLR